MAADIDGVTTAAAPVPGTPLVVTAVATTSALAVSDPERDAEMPGQARSPPREKQP